MPKTEEDDNKAKGISHLERLAAEFEHHWTELRRIHRELYDQQVESRKVDRARERILREIEKVIQPEGRINPEVTSAAGVRDIRKVLHGDKA